jgi:hypothetical protein
MLNVEMPPEGRINNTPLPNPWAPRNHNNNHSSNASLSPTNSLGGISGFSFAGFPPSLMNFPTSSNGDRSSPSDSATPQTNVTHNSSTAPSGIPPPFPPYPQFNSSSSEPDILRRFQQVMQRYVASPQYLSRQQMQMQQQQQTFYPTSLFGAPNPFFMNMQQTPFGYQSIFIP